MAWFCTPGSDCEDETDTLKGDTKRSGQKLDTMSISQYRGLLNAATFVLTGNCKATDKVAVGRGKYVYESIFFLWVKAWFDFPKKYLGHGSAQSVQPPTIAFEIPYIDPRITQPDGSPIIYTFFANIEFLLPLCLKSIVMRYDEEVLSKLPPCSKVLLDENHLLLFEPFVQIIARGLLGQALAGIHNSESREVSLGRALESSDIVSDFFAGIFGILHPEHMRILLTRYYTTLRDGETEHLIENIDPAKFEWTEENLHRVRSSRLLRLRASEKLAILPSFLAVNYPKKYSGSADFVRSKKTTWLKQHSDFDAEFSFADRHPMGDSSTEQLPHSGWLAELLINDCLFVCSLSCETVVGEAMAQVTMVSQDMEPTKRPLAVLKRSDLIMFQSMGIQAVNIVYELILRRQAMDLRFQTDTGKARVAGLFAYPILKRSVEGVRWLARMEATHKVRSSWLLSFAYILQEAPEDLIRDFIKCCCNPQVMSWLRHSLSYFL